MYNAHQTKVIQIINLTCTSFIKNTFPFYYEQFIVQKKKTIERSIVLSQKSLLRNESSSTDPMRHLHTAAPQSGGRRNCVRGYS